MLIILKSHLYLKFDILSTCNKSSGNIEKHFSFSFSGKRELKLWAQKPWFYKFVHQLQFDLLHSCISSFFPALHTIGKISKTKLARVASKFSFQRIIRNSVFRFFFQKSKWNFRWLLSVTFSFDLIRNVLPK